MQTMRGRGGLPNQGSSQDGGFVRTQLRAGGINPTGLQQQPQLTRPPPMDQYQSPRLSMPQPLQPRFSSMGTRNPPVQTLRMPAPVPPPSSSSSSLAFVQPENGIYLITQVHSAGEFYGCSQGRERELSDLQNQLEDYYNRMGNDPSLSVGLLMNGDMFAVLHDNIYQRVVMKSRMSDSRILVQLLDRGDELTVDTSELLQIDKRYKEVHAFAQPFRLFGYEDSQSSASLTRTLKQAILKQYVQISLQGLPKNGFYPVEVILANKQSLNQVLLSNGTNVMPSAPGTRPNINPRPQALLESQVYSNSNRYQPNIGQDQSARAPVGQQRTSDLSNRLGASTETTRTPAARFGSDSQTAPNNMYPVNEVPPRFAQMANRSLQQTSIRDSTAPTAPRNDESERTSNAPGGQGGYQTKIFQRQNYNSSQPNNNNNNSQRGDENLGSTNYPKQSEQKRPNDEPRFETQMNDRPMDNNERRGGGFSNRGGGFQNRGDRESFNSRPNYERNNDGQGSAPSDEYPRRSENYSHRGGRGDYNRPGQDRPNSYRNQNGDQEQNNSNDSRGEYGNRRGGGYQNERGRGGYGGDNARRSDFRGGYRRGGGDREGDGRSARGGFGNWDEQKNTANAENNESGKTFSGWSASRPPAVKFEAGDSFPSIQIPKDVVEFVVSHIETPNDFFVQSLSNESAIVKLSENMQTDFKTAPETDFKSAKAGQVCLAKSSDGCWYRAIVLSINANQMKVRFVDFGDTTDVNSSTVRQLAKAHCSAAPYAYQCTFTDVTVAPNVKIDALNQRLAGERFQGKILSKISDNQFVLESDQLKKILIEANALKLKPESMLKRIPCAAVHFEPTEHRFYIQDDLETSKVIEDLVENEVSTAPTFSTDELGQLFNSKTIVIAPFDEDGYYRAIIQSEEADDQVKVYFVDFGNDSLCQKSVLQRCSEQLSSHAPQAKQCQLYGVSQNQLDDAFAFLQEKSDSDDIEVSIINEKDNLLNVLVFIDKKCLNEQFGYNSSMLETPATEAKPVEPSNQQAETKTAEPSNQSEKTKTAEPLGQPGETKAEEPSNQQVETKTAEPSNQSEKTKVEEPSNQPERTKIEEPSNQSDEKKAEEPSSQLEETKAEVEEQSKVDEALLASTNDQDASTTAEPTTVEPKAEDDTTPKSRQGTLTHLEQNRPYVYLQLVPDSEPIIEQIHELIEVIVQADKHEASYNVGDHVIAQFSEDDAHYRGRLESYSSTAQTYSVYFLDYGNLDESVPVDRVFSYSEELENIEPQARGYLLDKIDENTWEKSVRSLVEGKLNETVEFTVLDEKACVIRLKLDYEEKVPVSQVEPTRTFQAQICAIEKDSFYIHRLLPDDESRLSQIKTTLQTCARDHRTSGTWSVNDACLVSDEHDRFYRGQIVAIEENEVDVKCIDDGKILHKQTDEHLYVVPADEILAQAPLAHQCRLHAADEAGQPEAIEQTVRPIQPTESVKITVENELDATCWSVTLSCDSGDAVNDRYESDAHDNDEDNIKQQSDTDKNDEQSSSDSAIDEDDDGEPNGPTNARATPTVETPVEGEKKEEQVGETNTPNEEPELSSPVSNTPNTESGESDPSTTPKDEPSPSISSA